MLFEIVAQTLAGDAFQDEAGPVDVDLVACQYGSGGLIGDRDLPRTPT